VPEHSTNYSKELLTQPAAVAPMLLNAPWLRVAMRDLGVDENNLENDAKISSYLHTVSCPLITIDEAGHSHITDWCSAFVNSCMKRAFTTGTSAPNARSWMRWGHAARPPRLGDVTVFWRVKGKNTTDFGHVGFFIRYSGPEHLIILGGNQHGSSVSFARLPINKNGPGKNAYMGLLGFRRSPQDAIAGDLA
jgi:uncharacterized protein (TIGR02594 family)